MTPMATIYVDNQPFEVDGSNNVLADLLSLGIDLPYFCWHPAMGSVGACRQCAVKQFRDEKDTRGKLVMACMTASKDGTRISLQDPDARAFRASIIEWLMENHPHDCPVCDEGSECHLQDMTVMTGHDYRRYRADKRTFRNQYLGPFVNHEMNRCIQCYRCVRFYRDYAGDRDFNVFKLHNTVYFGRYQDGVLESEFSGNLVEVCPTGVFTDATLKHHYVRKWDMTTAPSVCVNCSVGCNTIPAERYGTLRRIRARYNGHVNGSFLCDRGRYGYEFVNSERRIRNILVLNQARGSEKGVLAATAPVDAFARDPGSGIASPEYAKPRIVPTDTSLSVPEKGANRERLLQRIADLVVEGRVVGIGSPRASLESNFALRALVGPDNYYQGVPESEARLVKLMIDIMRRGPAHAPWLKRVQECDAVLVLGEDVSNTAPMLALSLRQTIWNQPIRDISDKLRIPHWDAQAVRNAIGSSRGPFFIATPPPTRLDDIATATFRAAPDDIARFGHAIARRLGADIPEVTGLSMETGDMVSAVADILRAAKRPLIISGPSLGSEAIIQAAANAAWACSALGLPTELSFVMPEVNSFGLGLMEGGSLDKAMQAEADTVIVLENDLYRRAQPRAVDAFLRRAKHVIVLDSLINPTTIKAEMILPAATFAEGDGTFVNNEGRAQRFYQVCAPVGEIRESWRWIGDLMAITRRTPTWQNLDDITNAMIKAMPVFEPVRDIAPPAGFRISGMRIARQHSRFSGRTAMHAHINVNEPVPPNDPDSPLAFSMEGASGPDVPPSLIPRFWAPGWNSAQAINKFQNEVGGELRGGDPGQRLVEAAKQTYPTLFGELPDPYQRRADEWLIVPLYHVFGSEELSMLSPGVAELAPKPYVALNPDDAAALNGGSQVQLTIGEWKQRLPVKLVPGLPAGVAGLPVGLPDGPFLPLPARGRLTLTSD